MDTNITKKNTPLITITKKVLEDLCNILNDSYNAAKSTQSSDCHIEYKLVSKTEVIVRTDLQNFLDHYSSKDLEKIEMNFKSKGLKILLKMDFNDPKSSKYMVTGNNSVNVTCTAKNIDRVFEKYIKENKSFRLNWKIGLPIYVAITAVLSLPLAVFFHKVLPVSESFVITYIIIFAISILPSIIFWSLFLKWLFPLYGTAYTAKLKYRVWILDGIIIFAILISLLLIFFSLS